MVTWAYKTDCVSGNLHDLAAYLNQPGKGHYDVVAAELAGRYTIFLYRVPDQPVLTPADIDQLVEGIQEFIIAGDGQLETIWQPYIDKLRAL